jgi:CHAD domain-containing protein
MLLEPLTEPLPERKAQKVLKRRLKYLGRLRDAQIQRMEISAGKRRFAGLAIAEQKLARREDRLIKAALNKISGFKTRKLQDYVEAMRSDLVSKAAKDSEILGRVRQSAQEAFDEVVRRRIAIDPAEAETIHRTRVAFKRFRYIVEGLSPAFTSLSRTQLQPLSDFQTSMGDIQDLEITENWLSEFIQEYPDAAAGVRAYLNDLRRRKVSLQKAFVKAADRLYEFWPIARLDNVIRTRSTPPLLRFAVHESGSVSFLGTERRP